MNAEERFWSKVDRRGPAECWPWLAYVAPTGYGQVKIGGRQFGAHRVAYELAVGPIPDGLQIDHLCRNRACVNPSHMEAVTQQVNLARGDAGLHNAIKTHCPAGHPYDDENTVIVADGRRRCRACRRARGREHTRAYRARMASNNKKESV